MRDDPVVTWPEDIENGKKIARCESDIADGIHYLETRSEQQEGRRMQRRTQYLSEENGWLML